MPAQLVQFDEQLRRAAEEQPGQFAAGVALAGNQTDDKPLARQQCAGGIERAGNKHIIDRHE